MIEVVRNTGLYAMVTVMVPKHHKAIKREVAIHYIHCTTIIEHFHTSKKDNYLLWLQLRNFIYSRLNYEPR